MVLATHDLNLAARLCDTVLLLREGRVLALGPTREVLTPSAIRQLYDVEAEVRYHDAARQLTVIPIGRLS
jgi:iron complex transport system ATP-binding protein